MSPQRKKLVTEIILAAGKMAEIIREADTTCKIPQSEWTIGDMAAHVIVTQKILTSLINGKQSPYIKNKNIFIIEAGQNISREYIANINKIFLSKYTQRNGSILAKAFIDEFQSFIKESETIKDNKVFKTHYGEMDISVLLSYSLTHLLIHGSTSAKTLHKPLPVTMANTGLTIPFMKAIMIKLYDKKAAKNFTGNFVLALKGSETFVLLCTPKGLCISNVLPESVDCSLQMDPLTFFLISNGYLSQWKALVLGKVFLSGKKPWLALKLPTLFKGL
jgi:hypothetical protein